MKDIINLGVVNFPVVWGDKAANLKQMEEYIEAAGQTGGRDACVPRDRFDWL